MDEFADKPIVDLHLLAWFCVVVSRHSHLVIVFD